MSHEARKILNELRDAKEEINKMKKDVFDVFSKRGFKNVEQRLKDLENFVGLEAYGSYHGSNNLQKKVENLERKIDELKRNWRF